MESLSSYSSPSSSSQPQPVPTNHDHSVVPEMEAQPRFTEDSSSVWDLSYLLDFNLDNQLAISLDYDQNLQHPEPSELPPQENLSSDKVRKRDPRLICSNYLSGRVPCSCPELDEKLEQEGLPGKKRARTVRGSAGVARCQVPGCEADISELKGYHRRHRVCLRCANASTVLLDGEAKRYCQQCGKFHILSDFDEGKRSCRRKLERHNNRRRRRPADSKAITEDELQPVMQTEEVKHDGESGKDGSNLSGEITEKGASLEHEDGQVTPPCSALDTQNINSDSVVSFVSSGETQTNGGKEKSNFTHSPSYCDNKSAYSSMCPTGRISFKLYDWNPAEFPRRLRHQIFQWLASMPVELEGYIRPGCTILTVFVAMPKIMWMKLLEDPMCYVRDIVAPGKMLSGKGTIVIRLNDMIFGVIEDGTSVMQAEAKLQAPRLHYVHPTYFEAGKPMVFVACGSNLLQPKFRLLVSFSGKYLKSEYCVKTPHSWRGGDSSCAFENQLYRIYIPYTEPNLLGPAFIEVENESGLSNVIPVLIGDKEVSSEMRTLQHRLDASLLSKQFQSAFGGSICCSCECSTLRNTAYSDLVVDIGWLLKDPTSESFHRALTASQIQRLCYLLDFLISNDSTTILRRILRNLMVLTENVELKNVTNGMTDVDVIILQKCMHNARHVLDQKHQIDRNVVVHSVDLKTKGYKVAHSDSQDNMPSVAPIDSQGVETRADAIVEVLRSPTSDDKSERIPLLNKDIIMNVDPIKEMHGKCGHTYRTGQILSLRPAILVIASVALCVGICGAILHPSRVGEFAVSIRRCLFN